MESNGEEGSVTFEPIGDIATHPIEINPRLLPITEESARSTPWCFLAALVAREE